ncbi:putative secreted protein [Cryptosporidium felis]|nr:putative secreted protein [Cryptosporidium felis]
MVANPFNEEIKEEDVFAVNGSLYLGCSNENSQSNLSDTENETMQFLSHVRSIMESYWNYTDIKFSSEAVSAVTKLSYNYIDKLMTYAIKLSNSKNVDQKLLIENVLAVLENDDRKHKRAQDVIRSFRRHQELLSTFDDKLYIKY